MSRSNPTENTNPNPAVRFFEWNGEGGAVRYYDKTAKKKAYLKRQAGYAFSGCAARTTCIPVRSAGW